MSLGSSILSARRSAQRGLSLIELLIGIALGLLVLAGIVTVFGSSRTAYDMGSANARLQENMRFAMELLKPQFREVANRGFCAGNVELNNHLRQDCGGDVTDLYAANESVHGWEFLGTAPGDSYTITGFVPNGAAADWASARPVGGVVVDTTDLPTALLSRVVPGTDVLVIRNLAPVPGITACNNNKITSSQVGTCGVGTDKSQENGILKNEIVLITNCATSADMFQNRSNDNSSNIVSGTGSCTNPGPGNDNTVGFSHQYGDDSQVLRVSIYAYYIGFNAARQQPGLYRINLGGRSAATGAATPTPEELVEGIENMQLLFGVSLEGAANNDDGRSIDDWFTADEVPSWGRVLATRVSLLARSPDPADPTVIEQTFDLSGPLITAQSDRRLRQVAHSTISFRNRVVVP